MKNLIIINGPASVGKSTTCGQLYKRIKNAVWLDGDWCWLMNPWNFSEENKQMVVDNIVHILNNYLKNPNFEYIIFSWVIPDESIFNTILERLTGKYELCKISLVCTDEELRKRCLVDNRDGETIERTLDNLKNYSRMNTIKIDTTNKDVEQVIGDVMRIINKA
jgi:broad-specificity NMP kinase